MSETAKLTREDLPDRIGGDASYAAAGVTSVRQATLDVVIVNWNAGPALGECIDSVRTAPKEGLELQRVVVVDNASTDGSLSLLDGADLPLTVVQNHENRGFAAGCNQGAQGTQAEYVLFLNPDTRLIDDALGAALRFMEAPAHEKVGIVGVQLVDEEGRIGRSCARFPALWEFSVKMLGLDRLLPGVFRGFIMDEWDHAQTREVDHVMGAFFLVRREVYERLQGFDERFFVYLEDLDFSLRARSLGWRSVYLAEAKVYHKGGGTSDQVRAMRLYHALRSRIVYAYKHFSLPRALVVTVGTLCVEPLVRLLWATGRGARREIAETLHGYTMLWGSLPSTLSLLRSAWKS